MKHYPIQEKVNRSISYENKEMLYFSGTNYLGMGNIPEFENLIIEGIKKYGPSHGSSRGSNLQLQVYENFEQFFCTKAGAEKGLLFSSGFIAGLAAVKTLKANSDIIIAAPDAHPAIFPHEHAPNSSMSFDQWIDNCTTIAKGFDSKRFTFLSNAVDPLKLNIHSFDWMKDLPDTNHYTLLIDDSHAFGILGKDIFGTYAKWRDLPVDLVVCGSLGKALGLPGGIVLGKKKIIDKLEQEAMFRSASPPAPAFCEAFLNAQHIYTEQKKKLEENVTFFKDLINGLFLIHYKDNYPVFAFEDEKWVTELEQENIIISSFPYPSLTDPCVNRIVLSAYHTKHDLIILAERLKKLEAKSKSQIHRN